MKRKALGRGLSSLIPEVPVAGVEVPSPEFAGETYREIDLDRIDPNPSQPRQEFTGEKLEELASSIGQHGVMQPIVVRRWGERFQVVVGERRLRASQRAGLLKIPALVRDIADARMGVLAVVENLQRSDLNPVEEGQAYRAMIDELGMTQVEVAEQVGKDRTTISNSLRLLTLSDFVLSALRDGNLSPGHARPLLSLEDVKAQDALARRIMKQGLSVRQVEKRVSGDRPTAPPRAQPEPRSDPNTRAAQEEMIQALGTKVRITRQGKGGTVMISFHDEEELERIFEVIVK